jgi:hypothetical protein
MEKKKPKRSGIQLTDEQRQQLLKDRELITKEIPALTAKHQRLTQAKDEPTMSGALRRAIHSSKILLPDLAGRVGTDLDTLDAFLTGEQALTSDVIDRLAILLKLKLTTVGSKRTPPSAKAG